MKLAIALAAAILAGAAAGPARAQGGPLCQSLAAPGLLANTTVGDAHLVAADPAQGTPEFCAVTATIAPVPGSHIGVVFRLPSGWNGKLLGLGGGGWAGNVRLASAAPGLAAGYATAQTDGGHPGTAPWDTGWAAKGTAQETRAAITDFSYRAVHLMTETGKAVVLKYYRRAQSRAYFQGCSTGGRQGLMEVQRFPQDYDGVISGAPVYDLIVQTTGLYHGQLFGDPERVLTPAQLALVNRAATEACDGIDGLKDGIITDPRQCHFDPGVLQCQPGQGGDACLTERQVDTVRKLYAGVTTKDGRVSAWPLSRGSEPAWTFFAPAPGSAAEGGLGELRRAMFGDANFDLARFDPDRDLARIHTGELGRQYEASDPDIAPFLGHGGKLLLWHGFYDMGPSPLGTIQYYERMAKATGAKVADIGSSARLFLAPGVYHCANGPGPDQFDALGTLDRWVTKGEAPERIIATKKGARISRPLCPYPALPRYDGTGDPDDAASFVCR